MREEEMEVDGGKGLSQGRQRMRRDGWEENHRTEND